MKILIASFIIFYSIIGFSAPSELDESAFGSSGSENSPCTSFLTNIDPDQIALVVESLKNDPATQDVVQAHADLLLAQQSLMDSVKSLRATYDRQNKFQIMTISWVARRLAKEFKSVVQQGRGQRPETSASLNDVLRNFLFRDALNRDIVSNALNYGEKLRDFESKRKLVEDNVFLAFSGHSERIANLIQERKQIEDLMCQLDKCLRLAPHVGEQSARLILESADLFSGFKLVSFGSWILGGTGYSVRLKKFFEKLQELENTALPLGHDVRGFRPQEQLGYFHRLFRAWSNGNGPMGGIDHQGVDLFWDALQADIGIIHSGNFVARSAAQMPQIWMAKKRMTMLELKLKLRDSEISNEVKPVVCEILKGCDHDDEAAWDEVLTASGLK